MNPISDYLAEVAAHLRLRGSARRHALTDLHDLLTEQAQGSSAADAVAQAGPASDYAANLDAQFGAHEGAQRLLGVPLSISRGVVRRMAGTFNPADERCLVPKVFGAGWTFNMGAVAVRLGLLNPDDVDDEVLATAADEQLAGPQLAAAAGVLAAAATGLWQLRQRHEIQAATGKPQGLNVAAGLVIPALAGAALVASTDRQAEPAARLTMPAIAASLSGIAIGANLQQILRPGGQAWVLTGAAAASISHLLLAYLPTRAAIRAGMRQQQASEPR